MVYKKYFYDAVVVGSGAAGYNAICRLNKDKVKKAALVTESRLCGTSRNTGSDKQTYYKLSLGGEFPDSVAKMAHDLFSCGSVDGDNALCEAALSARCFMNLCELGVEFPVNRYGEYIGYKTDHDPYERATSAGPLTSKYMTEALERQALKAAPKYLTICWRWKSSNITEAYADCSVLKRNPETSLYLSAPILYSPPEASPEYMPTAFIPTDTPAPPGLHSRRARRSRT